MNKSPPSLDNSPVKILNKVDLPAPFIPMIPILSLPLILKVTFSKMLLSKKDFSMSFAPIRIIFSLPN